MLLLPHCLKHAEGCPADYDQFGLDCKQCGACSIADFRTVAEEMGYKVLVAEGQDDFTRGHISMRLPDNPGLFFMKPHSLGLDEITMENILTIDLEGNVTAGTSKRHSEVYIHSEIFKVRPDVNCVLHTHPLNGVAVSAQKGGVLPISQQSIFVLASLGYSEDEIIDLKVQGVVF